MTADVFSKEKRSQVMSQIRGYGNKGTELELINIMRRNGICGWRRNRVISIKIHRDSKTKLRSSNALPRFKENANVTLRIKPDFVFSGSRVALFVDGCFWHVCPRHFSLPVENRPFWKRKFEANTARDRNVNRSLRDAGWIVTRIWEHELDPKNENRIVSRLKHVLNANQEKS